MCTLQEQSWFLTALLSAPLVPKLVKGTHFPSSPGSGLSICLSGLAYAALHLHDSHYEWICPFPLFFPLVDYEGSEAQDMTATRGKETGSLNDSMEQKCPSFHTELSVDKIKKKKRDDQCKLDA